MEMYRIKVDSTKDLPFPVESVENTKRVQGSFLGLFDSLGLPSPVEKVSAKARLTHILEVLKELDSGETGKFNYQYFMEADQKQPELQMIETFKKKMPNADFEKEEVQKAYAYFMRLYLRKMTFRFFTYYKMGYQVSFEKM